MKNSEVLIEIQITGRPGTRKSTIIQGIKSMIAKNYIILKENHGNFKVTGEDTTKEFLELTIDSLKNSPNYTRNSHQ
jgi:broad-specificity NMP kinase